MFKKILAAAATLILGAGLAVGAVAAPASAHDGIPVASCDVLTVDLINYDTPNGDLSNSITVTIDDDEPITATFGNSYKNSFPYSGDTSHTYTVVVDADGSSFDKTFTGTSTACVNPVDHEVDCDAVTSDYGRALQNGDHINMDIVDGSGKKFQLNAYVDQNVAGGYQGLGLVIHGYPSIPLTQQQVETGRIYFEYSTYLEATSYTVEWVQMNSTYFNQDRDSTKFLHCGETTTPVSVSDVPRATPPTCGVDGALVLPTNAHIVFSSSPAGTGPGTYEITASAESGYVLTGPKTFTVEVLPKTAATGCTAPPACIPGSAVSYTYDASTNSGNIHVESVDSTSGELCKQFWVTATTWKYLTDSTFPQVLDQVQYVNAQGDTQRPISKPGDYPYGIDTTCGQGDIYASFDAQPEPTQELIGPNNPFAEHFLHDMGFTGPTPTYTQDTPGCNIVIPTVPTATAITECGTYGSINVPADTAKIDYTVTGSGNQGTYTVTAKAFAPYTLQGYPEGGWSFDLGTFTACVTVCDTVTSGGASTNLDANGWTFAETRATGHNAYVDGGLHVYTEGATSTDKAAGYHALSIPLTDVGAPSITMTDATGGKPGLQIGIDLDGNGTQDGYLVGEGDIYGAGNYWTTIPNAGVPSAYGYASVGSLQQYSAANPNAKVTSFGYSLGSGVLGSVVITKITIGCKDYTFDAATYAPAADATITECFATGTEPATSAKNVVFTFVNTNSTMPVTFTVPSENITMTVAAGETAQVPGTPVTDLGASYDVFADGALLRTMKVDPFVGCLPVNTPTEPAATAGTCVAGDPGDGSIWVDLRPSLVYTITGVANSVLIPDVSQAVTAVPAGSYIVSVKVLPGNVYTGPTSFALEVPSATTCQIVVAPVPPKTAISCDTNGSYTLPGATGVAWFVDGVSQAAGKYTVTSTKTVVITAEASSNSYGLKPGVTKEWTYSFAEPVDCSTGDDDGSSDGPSDGDGSSDGPSDGDDDGSTDGDSDGDTPSVTPPTPTFQDVQCTTGGSFSLPAASHVGWLVDGVEVTAPYSKQNVFFDQEFTVQAVPTGGATFDSDATTRWVFDFASPVTCDLPTHPLVTPTVTSTPLACTTQGSYTLSNTEGIAWTANGAPVAAGTYPVSSAQVVNVTAATTSTDYGFDYGAKTAWQLNFTKPTACGDLPTLAFTGVASALWLNLAGGLVFLGIGGLLIARRRFAPED